MRCLGRILGISWTGKVTNSAVFERASIPPQTDACDRWVTSAAWKTDASSRTFSIKLVTAKDRPDARNCGTRTPANATPKRWASTPTPGKQPPQTGPPGTAEGSLSFPREPDAAGIGGNVTQEDSSTLTDRQPPSPVESATESATPASVSSRGTMRDGRTQRRRTPWSPMTDGSLPLQSKRVHCLCACTFPPHQP